VPPDEQRRLHGALADAYGDQATWSALPDDEHYSWRRLAYHLLQAERSDDLRALLTDGAYLQGKISRLGTTALLADFALTDGDETVERIAGALRLGAHILDREPRELSNQLQGRLGLLPDLHNLPVDDKPHFRLESQTLTPPGGPLLRTLEGHTASVNDCAFSPDGPLALSASADTTLRLWAVATGAEVARWHADAPLHCCAFHPDGRRAIAGDSFGICTGCGWRVFVRGTAEGRKERKRFYLPS
jgi:WD40 repeat protein